MQSKKRFFFANFGNYSRDHCFGIGLKNKDVMKKRFFITSLTKTILKLKQ